MSNENPYVPPSAEITGDGPGDLASRWKRFFGVLIDGLVIMAVTFPLLYVTGYLERAGSGAQSLGEIIFMGLLGLAVFFAVNGYLLKNKGQTVGKLLMGTQIVSIEDGSLLPFGKLIGLRYVPLWLIGQVPGIGQLAGLVNALFIFRADKRCVHDLIAGTKVINYRGAVVSETRPV